MTQAGDDPLVDLAHVANSQLSLATAPGAYYVDFAPLGKSLDHSPMFKDTRTFTVKHVPSWLPGSGFKTKAKKYSLVSRDFVEIPHNYVKRQLVSYLVSHVEVC